MSDNTATVNAYAATMLLAEERPDLIPLVRLMLGMGDEAFNEGLDELVRRGILEADAPAPSLTPGPSDRDAKATPHDAPSSLTTART